MDELPVPADEAVDETADAGRVIEVTDPDLPDFAPRAPLTRWDTSGAGAVGFEYEGDHDALITVADRVRLVRAAMDRDAGT